MTAEEQDLDPAIADHRLLGDGRTTALVLPDGAIDWWCAPEPDSAPLLWRLLDRVGPSARWVGAHAAGHGREIAGHGLRTTVAIDGALVQLLDGLVETGDGVVLGRFVRAVDRAVELVHEVGPGIGGFDGQLGEHGTWTISEDAATADPADCRVTVSADGPIEVAATTLRIALRATPDRWRGIVLSVGAAAVPEPADVVAAIEAAMAAEADAIAACRLPGTLTDVALDALAVLRACTCTGSGAVIAAPTTSLPEVVGGDRQFDYRYCWLRDSAQAVSVAVQLGRDTSARELFDFLASLGPSRLLESPLFTVRGGDVPAERSIAGIAGFGGSRPVRVGNDATGQVQHDVLGIVLESITAFAEFGFPLRRRDLAIVGAFADRALDEPGPTSGIWELRDPAQLVSADIGRWVALDRAAALACSQHQVRWLRRRRRWTAAAGPVRDRVLDALRPDGGLPQRYGDDGTHDASALLAVIYGLIASDDPRASGLVDATLDALGEGPFLRRYAGIDDGFAPGEGAFLPASWWAVSALAVCGRKDEAKERADAMLAVLPGLQPEEVDVATGVGLGNVPLLWAHTEAARAAVLLDRA